MRDRAANRAGRVTLLGGPFDGQQRAVEQQRRLLTLEWEDETVERDDEDGCVLYVTRLGIATYRRTGETTFEHCRTPTAPGDTDLDLPALED